MFMTGRNEWRQFETWPPSNLQKEKLYLHAEGKLDFIPDTSINQSFEEYISDPKKPVPYTEDITLGMTKEYMTDDQRFAAARPDVLVFQTEILNEDMVFAGPLKANLFVSTTGTDADWVVKIIDVYPNDAPDNQTTRKGMHMGGYQQMIRSEIIRGRYRNSYEKPEPFTPGKIETINLELQDILHCFKKGHRIMVQVQSSWFPLADINPQKYVENIFKANKEDFIKATQRIYHDKNNISSIEAGILKE
jgi:uncharacterized protein